MDKPFGSQCSLRVGQPKRNARDARVSFWLAITAVVRTVFAKPDIGMFARIAEAKRLLARAA